MRVNSRDVEDHIVTEEQDKAGIKTTTAAMQTETLGPTQSNAHVNLHQNIIKWEEADSANPYNWSMVCTICPFIVLLVSK
jgi:hypothetical protein